MDTNMQQQILNRLDALAAKLGVAAKYLLALYVRQSVIDGFEAAVAGVLFLALAGVSAKVLLWAVKESTDSYGDYEELGWIIASSAIGVIALILGVVCLVNSADLLCNPQLWAFKALLADVK